MDYRAAAIPLCLSIPRGNKLYRINLEVELNNDYAVTAVITLRLPSRKIVFRAVQGEVRCNRVSLYSTVFILGRFNKDNSFFMTGEKERPDVTFVAKKAQCVWVTRNEFT